ncbi:MAG: MarR family winged helix-turn-helix transcriptional regulator [Candidatus Nanopelagicales bacterium]
MQATDSQSLVVSLYRATRLVQQLTSDDPLDPAAARVLSSVKRMGPARPSAVAHDNHIDLSTASRHLDALQRHGYISKQSDPQDARASLVTLTAAGRRVMRTLLDNRRRAIAPVFESWTPEDRELLEKLLARFADDLDNHLEPR